MSAVGDTHSSYSLTELGRLKLLERLIRFGQAIPVNEYKVLLFIYDRTHAWGRSIAPINDNQFLNGVAGGRNDMAAAPLGLTLNAIHDAVTSLVSRRAIRVYGPLPRRSYSIVEEWEMSGFRRMWRVEDDDYRFPKEI